MGISSTRVCNDFFNILIRVWAIPSVTSLHCIILQIWINSHGDHKATHYLAIERAREWGWKETGSERLDNGGVQEAVDGESGEERKGGLEREAKVRRRRYTGMEVHS